MAQRYSADLGHNKEPTHKLLFPDTSSSRNYVYKKGNSFPWKQETDKCYHQGVLHILHKQSIQASACRVTSVAAMLRKNICFPNRSKNFPKLSFKILFQPKPMQSNQRVIWDNHAKISATTGAALLLAAFWSSFLFNEVHSLHPMFPFFPRKQSLIHKASLPETLLLHSLPLLPHTTWNIITSRRSQIPHLTWPPFLINQTSLWPSCFRSEHSWGLAQLETLHFKT